MKQWPFCRFCEAPHRSEIYRRLDNPKKWTYDLTFHNPEEWGPRETTTVKKEVCSVCQATK